MGWRNGQRWPTVADLSGFVVAFCLWLLLLRMKSLVAFYDSSEFKPRKWQEIEDTKLKPKIDKLLNSIWEE